MAAFVRLAALVKRVRYGLLTLTAVAAVLTVQGGLVHLALRGVDPTPPDEAAPVASARAHPSSAPLRLSSDPWSPSGPGAPATAASPRPVTLSAGPSAASTPGRGSGPLGAVAAPAAAPGQTAARVEGSGPAPPPVPVTPPAAPPTPAEASTPDEVETPEKIPVPWGRDLGEQLRRDRGRDCPKERSKPSAPPRGYHCGWEEQSGTAGPRTGGAGAVRSPGAARPDR